MKYGFSWEQASRFKVAIQQRDLNTVKSLLDSGFDCDHRFRTVPAICLCVETGNPQLVQLLISARCSLNQSSPFFKKSPLHIATEQGYEEIVNLLLWNRASVNLLDNDKNTPLHLAVYRNNLRVIQSLVDNGSQINKRNSKGTTPLMIACELGNVDITEYLLSKGANPKIRDCLGRASIFYSRGKAQILKLLLKYGALLDSSKDFCYLSDILSKKDCTHPETFELLLLLLEAGVNIDEIDYLGTTPLHNACVAGKEDMVRLLVQMGCKLNQKNNLGLTPMFHAAVNGYSSIVRFLHCAGVPMHTQPFVVYSDQFWKMETPEIRDYVLRHAQDVPRLGVLCRESLRRHYKHHFLRTISNEVLPSSLKQYLMYYS